MKKVIKPATNEISEYFCDFTGEKLIDYVPVQVKISFGYGSKYDGSFLQLHLCDSAGDELIDLLKNKLSASALRHLLNND